MGSKWSVLWGGQEGRREWLVMDDQGLAGMGDCISHISYLYSVSRIPHLASLIIV